MFFSDGMLGEKIIIITYIRTIWLVKFDRVLGAIFLFKAYI